MNNNVGVVLFHGAGLGSWIWQRVGASMQGPTLAIDLPGRAGTERGTHVGLEQCVEHVLSQIAAFECDRLVLVGHSVSGGLVMRVAERLGDRIASVVMVGAVVPKSGSAYVSELPWLSRTMLKVLYTVKPQGMAVPDGVLAKALCNDLDQNTKQHVLNNTVVALPRLFLDPVSWSLPANVPCTYVCLTNDSSDVTPAMQQQMAVRLGARVVELHSGHLPMLSQPEALADILDEATRSA